MYFRFLPYFDSIKILEDRSFTLLLAIRPEWMRYGTPIALRHSEILRNQDFNQTRFIILVLLPDRLVAIQGTHTLIMMSDGLTPIPTHIADTFATIKINEPRK